MAGAREIGERLFVRAASIPLLSRLTARLSDLRLPGALLRPALRAYVRAYGVDLSEADAPLDAYPTFNAFFTRRLRVGARPVAAEPAAVVSPCDSRVHSLGPVPESGLLEQVKGRTYALAALLGSEEDARPFRGGLHATLYLSPSMYHRVHSPVDGRVLSWRYVPGRLFPVNGLAVRHVEGLFAVNERLVVVMDAPDLGPVAVVMVGAANVGRMTLSFAPVITNSGRPASLSTPPEPIPLARGAELGVFNLGSTVVLLLSKRDLAPAAASVGDLLRMGQPLWRRPS